MKLADFIRRQLVVLGVLAWGAGAAFCATTTLTYQVSTSADDGYAWSATGQNTTAGYLLISDERTYDVPYQMSAMRFNNVNVPRSATIISAHLKISSINTDYRNQIYGIIAAEASDNPADFSGRLIGNAALTAASVAWDFKDAWLPDTQYISPDVSTVLQEVINRPGFSGGNSIAIYYSTRDLSGKARSFASYEYNPASAAVLEVTYETYTISGHILTTEATGLEGVAVSAGADIESDVTDSTGYYELRVPLGWSGTVTPSKANWGFVPFSKPYSNVTSNQTGQNFTAFQPVISGHITEDGGGVVGVTVSADNGGGSDATDAAGYYEITVPYDWSGQLTADKLKWAITPESYSYFDLNSNQTDQNFNAEYISTIVVKADGTGYASTIQAAIDIAVSGDIVQIEDGTYTGDGNRDIDFLGKAITVRGATGDPNDVIIDCQGTEVEPHRGFKFVSSEDLNSILENLTITNGYGHKESFKSYYYSVGGAIYCKLTNPKILNCSFINNSAMYSGGAVFIYKGSPVFTDSIFINNSVDHFGGGICNWEGNIEVLRSTFTSNSSERNGGAIFNNDYSSTTLQKCTFNENYAQNEGGAVGNWDGTYLTVISCKFINNFANNNGGALGNRYSSYQIIIQSIFRANSSTRYGGAIFSNSRKTVIKNSLLLENTAGIAGGGLRVNYDNAEIVNSIIYNNFPEQLNQGVPTGSIEVSYSDIEGGWEGISILDSEPLLINGYHISPDSPCINAGDPNYVSEPNETDIDGNLRIVGTRIDMGADEFVTDLPFIFPSGNINLSFTILQAREYPEPETIDFYNLGLMDLNWTASSNVNWLNVNPTSGSTNYDETASINIAPDINNLSAGEYSGQVTISDPNALNNPKVINVNITVIGPALSINSNQFSFQASKVSLIAPDQILSVSNEAGGLLRWHVNIPSHCNWLSATPLSGQSIDEADEVALSIDVSGLDYGLYSCQLTVSDPNATNSPQVVTVNLDVLRPILSVGPGSFFFLAEKGDPNVAEQVLYIQNTGYDTLGWQIVIPPDVSWLIATPGAGQSAGEVDEVVLSVDASGLDNAVYNCELIVSDPNAENSPQIIAVNLHVFTPGEIHVPAEYPTIQAGIHAALEGDHVIVHPGVYTGQGNSNIYFEEKEITVRSIDPTDPNIVANTIVDLQDAGQSTAFGIYGEGYPYEDYQPTLDGLTIAHCSSGWTAISIRYGRPTIRNCVIRDGYGYDGWNRSSSAIICYRSSTVISNCVISNMGGGYQEEGGAIILGNWDQEIPADITINNCTITNNQSYWGAAIDCWGVNATINNCTIADNRSIDYGYGDGGGDWPSFGAGIIVDSSNVTINNCIFWGNIAGDGPQITILDWEDDRHNEGMFRSRATVSYSDVQGGESDVLIIPDLDAYWETGYIDPNAIDPNTLTWGPGNIDVDPMFVRDANDGGDGWFDDPETENVDERANNISGDYHLMSDSACIDAGDPNYVAGPGEVDIDGNQRVVDGDGDRIAVLDMGSDEYKPKYCWGAGTAEDPYQICEPSHLDEMGANPDDWDKHFVLMADIDMSGYTYSRALIAPDTDDSALGFQGTEFTGVFDGNGHAIANLVCESARNDYIGLFGCVDGPDAEIKDITLTEPDINAQTGYCVGPLVGYLRDGTITGCNSAGGSITGYERVGGVVGLIGAGTIVNCSGAVNVTGLYSVGGLVGQNSYNGTITNSCATGSATGFAGVGGLAGYNSSGAITQCYAGGDVTGDAHTGGLVGYNYGDGGGVHGNIANCYARGDVWGSDNAGGLVGSNSAGVIINCYGAGAVGMTVSAQDFEGGLVGLNLNGFYTKCFWDETVNFGLGGIGNGTDPDVIGESTANMQTESTFTDAGWDFVGETANGTENIWIMLDGANYPEFAWQNKLVLDLAIDNTWMYQNLPGQSNSELTVTVSFDDPLANKLHETALWIILPDDVSILPIMTDHGSVSDTSLWFTLAAPGCDQPAGLSDSGQAFTIGVTVTGYTFGNTATAEVEFGIALLGDVNNDKIVNLIDRIIMNVYWRTGSAGDFTFRDCNINCDDNVNLIDRIIANEIWRGVLGASSVSESCPYR